MKFKLLLGLILSLLTISSTLGWYDSNWNNRKEIIVNNTDTFNHAKEAIEMNITGLTLATNNCYELRITLNDVIIPYQVINATGYDIGNGTVLTTGENLSSGDQWCYVTFLADTLVGENKSYFVYYNNSLAINPNYDIIRINFDDYNSYTGQIPINTNRDTASSGVWHCSHINCYLNTTITYENVTVIFQFIGIPSGNAVGLRDNAYVMELHDGSHIGIYSNKDSAWVNTTGCDPHPSAIWIFKTLGGNTTSLEGYALLASMHDPVLCVNGTVTNSQLTGASVFWSATVNDWVYVYNGDVNWYWVHDTSSLQGEEILIQPHRPESGFIQTLRDIGQGTGRIFSSIGNPIIVILIGLYIATFVGLIMSGLRDKIEGI